MYACMYMCTYIRTYVHIMCKIPMCSINRLESDTSESSGDEEKTWPLDSK